MYVVLWSPADESGTSPSDTPKLFVFLGERFVLTVRRNTWTDQLDLRKRFDDDRDYLGHGPAGALHIALAAVSESYSRIVNAIERELEELEREVFDEAIIDDAPRIYRLRQRIGWQRRPLTSLVDALTRDAGDLAKLGDRHP